MLRAVGSASTRALTRLAPAASSSGGSVRSYAIPHHGEAPEVFDQRFLDFFNREDLDGWMVRKGMADLHAHDVIPEPKIISAALRACRRINDYGLAVRFLEAVKIKCGPKKMVDTIYPWLIQEVTPVLEELGISTPEAMGYDQPELFHPSTDFWEHKFYEEYGYDKKRDRYNF